jgi:hypothetical protein
MVNLIPRALLATLLIVAGPGCSLILTKGPEPEVHPTPECTTSNAAPVADTVLAATSAALAIAAAAVAAQPCPPGPPFSVDSMCGYQHLAWFPAGGALLTGILFTTSAVVGYHRTSACRASLLEPNGQPPPPPVVLPSALLPRSPDEPCAPIGDAPRACNRVVFSAGGI